jgi:hypothetical protein
MKMGDMKSGQLALIESPERADMHHTLVSKSWRQMVVGVSQPARSWDAPPEDTGVEVTLVDDEASILLVRDGVDNHNGRSYPKYKAIILPDFKLPE